MSSSSRVCLSVPYFSQLDNQNVPYGTCNLTSVAMVMRFFGIVGTGEGQLEDQLFDWVRTHGLSRHSPYDLVSVLQSKGLYDNFQSNARWNDVRSWLSAGYPVIVHGYFTRSGHIIVIRGYDDSLYDGKGAWLVNDPYGEWTRDGYDTSTSGECLPYSYRMMGELCGSDGDLWVHYVTLDP